MAVWTVYGGARTMRYDKKEKALLRAIKVQAEGHSGSVWFQCREGVYPRKIQDFRGLSSGPHSIPKTLTASEDPYE